MSGSEFARLSRELHPQPQGEFSSSKSDAQFMASATQLFMQHFLGKPGVHDLYSEKGFPVSSRAVDSSGAAREYTFADGTRYFEPTEPSTAHYADGASLALAPIRLASQGGSFLRVAGSAAGNALDYAATNYASRTVNEATGGYVAGLPVPVTAMLSRGRGASVVSTLDDGVGGSASSSAGVIYVNQAGEGISSSVLAKQGSSRLAGNFQGLNGGSFEEIVSRVPTDWTWAPQRGGNCIRFFDTAGKERIRIHGPNSKAPPGSNSRNGWVLRVTDRVGNFYDDLGRIQPDRLTNEGHIPIWGNPNSR